MSFSHIFPTETKRTRYLPKAEQRYNMVLAVDSYKHSHPFSYPKNIKGMTSYIEARTGGRDKMILAMFQAFIQRFFNKPITLADIDEAEAFCAAHGEPFARDAWLKVLNVYNGYMPVLIRAVPEGLPIPSGNAMVTITCLDTDIAENIFWLCSFLETVILRGVWYPSTIATEDFKRKQIIAEFYRKTGCDFAGLPFALHDFGGRGVTCAEQAMIGGAAHTVNFMGSDTMEGIRYANYWYDCEMAAFSVPATEHSVECSYGLSQEDELKYIDNQLTAFGKENAIISLVGDGKDIFRFASNLCIFFKDRIIKLHDEKNVKVVCRPDSGDPLEVVPQLLEMFGKAFGFSYNAAGYKVLYGGIGILQGDGVDNKLIYDLLSKLEQLGWAACNVVFGSGGALLQKVNRDTYKFAQKASAVLIDGKWVGIAKDPITDPGKKSKEGLLTTVRSSLTGEYSTVDVTKPLADEFTDVMQTVYDCGEFFNFENLETIRARVTITA